MMLDYDRCCLPAMMMWFFDRFWWIMCDSNFCD